MIIFVQNICIEIPDKIYQNLYIGAQNEEINHICHIQIVNSK